MPIPESFKLVLNNGEVVTAVVDDYQLEDRDVGIFGNFAFVVWGENGQADLDLDSGIASITSDDGYGQSMVVGKCPVLVKAAESRVAEEEHLNKLLEKAEGV